MVVAQCDDALVADASSASSANQVLVDDIMQNRVGYDTLKWIAVDLLRRNAENDSKLVAMTSRLKNARQKAAYWESVASEAKESLVAIRNSEKSRDWKPGRYFTPRGAAEVCVRRNVGFGQLKVTWTRRMPSNLEPFEFELLPRRFFSGMPCLGVSLDFILISLSCP
jgi:hypothetical protein